MNSTIKAVLEKLNLDNANHWDRYLHAALYAYSSIPNASTGFYLFKLMVGLRNVRSTRCPHTYMLLARNRHSPSCDLSLDIPSLIHIKVKPETNGEKRIPENKED
ncbi:integrase core domain [Plakobranchus ocellatus]|uniref:Integrase core domain n=1 Tax=Plakobranchus ocellatus TaxID=259542 RepID=A0AAV4CHN9_9GAST|nr:integrase core domain [Plakobranchus ocellatus]